MGLELEPFPDPADRLTADTANPPLTVSRGGQLASPYADMVTLSDISGVCRPWPPYPEIGRVVGAGDIPRPCRCNSPGDSPDGRPSVTSDHSVQIAYGDAGAASVHRIGWTGVRWDGRRTLGCHDERNCEMCSWGHRGYRVTRWGGMALARMAGRKAFGRIRKTPGCPAQETPRSRAHAFVGRERTERYGPPCGVFSALWPPLLCWPRSSSASLPQPMPTPPPP